MPRARVSTAMPMSHLLCAMKPSRTESAELPTITAPTTVSRLTSSAPTCSAWTGVMTYMVPSPGPPSSMKRTRDSPFSRACSSTDCASWSIESSGILPEFAETIFSSNVCCRFGEPRVGGASRKSMGTTAATSKPYWLMTLLSMVSTSVLVALRVQLGELNVEQARGQDHDAHEHDRVREHDPSGHPEADPPAQASHRSGGSLRHDGSLLLGHGTHCATCETRLGGTESLLVRGRIIIDQRPSREPRSEPGRGSGHGTGHRCPSEREADRPGRHRRAHEHLVVADAGGRFDRVEHGPRCQRHRAGAAGPAAAGV